MLKAMQKKNAGISKDILTVFEGIIQKYARPGFSLGHDCDKEFSEAMEEHLSKEQRFRLYEQNGGCMGTGRDKERKAFALKHANKTIAERIELFARTYGKNVVLKDDNTIVVTFTCAHRYHKIARDKGQDIPFRQFNHILKDVQAGGYMNAKKHWG